MAGYFGERTKSGSCDCAVSISIVFIAVKVDEDVRGRSRALRGGRGGYEAGAGGGSGEGTLEEGAEGFDLHRVGFRCDNDDAVVAFRAAEKSFRNNRPRTSQRAKECRHSRILQRHANFMPAF